MVVPDITNVFFASLVHGVEALAERDGYDLLIVSSSEDSAKSGGASRRSLRAGSTA
jgi:DNA-binding LacI/PurR family transcriptional regulator